MGRWGHERWAYTELDRFVGNKPSLRELAELIGVTMRTVSRWRRYDLTTEAADKAACTLGVHPCEIWEDWFS